MTISSPASTKGPERYALRIVGIAQGESRHVRMIANSYGGCWTHWKPGKPRGRTLWCSGDSCQLPQHKIGRTWKGYTAAQMWDQLNNVWAPVAFEISESLELDLRGRFCRGQIWLCSRDPVTEGKTPPVRGVLEETHAESQLPDPFDITPCVRTAFHAVELTLNVKNPMPPRIMVAAEKGAAPASLAPGKAADESSWRNDPAEREKLAALAQAAGLHVNGQRNGRH